jgi:hypothetical protein
LAYVPPEVGDPFWNGPRRAPIEANGVPGVSAVIPVDPN